MKLTMLSVVWGWAIAAGLAGAAESPEWVYPEMPYRIEVTVDPGKGARKQCPVGVEVDFAKIFADATIEGRLDRHSIRVAVSGAKPGESLPCQLTGDFFNTDKGRVWWRLADAGATRFHVYFDRLRGDGHAPPKVRGPVGIGDALHYNHGQPGPAPVHPLHSQYWHLDWDGDGRRDLIGFAFLRFEFGAPLEKNMGNGVFFLKNIGSAKEPLFAPKQRLQGDDGEYLTTALLPQNMFPVDWDSDGDTDFIGTDGRKNLLWWENSGQRDRNGLFRLKSAQTLTKLDGVSDFRAQAPGVARKPNFYIRAINAVDWHGDGGRDLIVSWSNTNILAKVDSKKGVIPYGAPLMIFELLEDIAPARTGPPAYAAPRVITEERGLPLNAATFATGGAAYVDWDGDGDHDLLFQDVTARPLEGGRLMFSENFGTRRDPIFLMPIPILRIDDSPQVLDWTGDGVIDLIAGGEFFENVNPSTGGTPDRPARATTAAGTRLPKAWSYPRLVTRGQALQTLPEMLGHWAASADWDGNGTLDLIRGMTRRVQVFFNRGTNLNPVFDPGVDLSAAGKPMDLPNWLDLEADPPHDRGPQGMGEAEHGWLNPTPVDFDRDGDLDLFVTGQRWQTIYFENTGTRTAPALARGREVRYRGNPQEFSWRSKPSLGDLDGDERLELVVTSDEDNVFYAYQPAAKQTDPDALEFDARRPLQLEDSQPVTGWHGGQNNNGDNHSLLVDWDADGDLDLINGTLWSVFYYENTGTVGKPVFKRHGKFKIGGEDMAVFRHAGSVDAADWSGDGRLDLLVSTENPSDQPLGEMLHLFDRAILENDLPRATLGKIESNSERN